MNIKAVKHPSHYTEGRKFEPKDVIRDWDLNFNLGSALKYIARAGRKDDIVQDLEKAREYLSFEVEAIKAERELKKPYAPEHPNCKCVVNPEEDQHRAYNLYNAFLMFLRKAVQKLDADMSDKGRAEIQLGFTLHKGAKVEDLLEDLAQYLLSGGEFE